MHPSEREVAGLVCSAVMAALSDFVDGDMPPHVREQIEAHVAACQWCERFGADFARLLATMRRHFSEPEPVPAAVAERLRRAIESSASR